MGGDALQWGTSQKRLRKLEKFSVDKKIIRNLIVLEMEFSSPANKAHYLNGFYLKFRRYLEIIQYFFQEVK